VERALRLLRVLSELDSARLTDLACAADLDKATALRLLETLVSQGFVARESRSKAYTLGAEFMVLGAAALRRFDPRPLARPSLMRLSSAFEDSAVLSIPSGLETLCIDVHEGSYPIRANYLHVGSRRPLGVGAGSLALLAWLPPEECEAAIATIGPQLGRYPRIGAARACGHAVLLDVVVERMGGIAVPILSTSGRPVGALSVPALTERITGREAELARALRHEATICQVRWADALHHTGPAAHAAARHGLARRSA
jgi:DNA-binding IclR family transcriptional regulator